MTSERESVRVDRWLWAIRLYKTRTAAAAACRAGHVAINGARAKAASAVRVGDRITTRLADRERDVEAARLIDTRVGAKVAVDCYIDHSPEPEPFDAGRLIGGIRDAGAGRPTKRDRREMERLKGRRTR